MSDDKCEMVCVTKGHGLRHCIASHDGTDKDITENKKEHFHQSWSIIGNQECRWEKLA